MKPLLLTLLIALSLQANYLKCKQHKYKLGEMVYFYHQADGFENKQRFIHQIDKHLALVKEYCKEEK